MSDRLIDLHAHSSVSDGTERPEELVAAAVEAGLDVLALTDHDSTAGWQEAFQAAQGTGLTVLPGIELSTQQDGASVHLLGYLVDPEHPALVTETERLREERWTRAEAMVQRIAADYALDWEDVLAQATPGATIGRPHIADAVLNHPANQERLRAEGISDKNGFFPRYIVPGAIAFVQRTQPTVQDAIEVIHAAGGVAVWAHPFWDIADAEEVLETIAAFADAGLDGVEVFYPSHTAEQTRLLHDTCRERGLLITGSSDFHGPGHGKFSRFQEFERYGLEPELGPIGTRSARV